MSADNGEQAIPPAGEETSGSKEGVALLPYDPVWVRLFEQEEKRLRGVFPEAGRIEHFGSTAIAGMDAKPIVDILLELDDPGAADVIPQLEKAGYDCIWRIDRTPAYPFCVKRDRQGRRTHHVHVHAPVSTFWQRLAFRDLLRVDEQEREAYLRVKRSAAALHRNDREAYTRAKARHVAQATKRAVERFR